MKKLLIVLSIFSTVVFAEDIRLKSGISIVNVKIIEQGENGFVQYQTSDGMLTRVHIDAVLEINNIPFDNTRDTETIFNYSDVMKTNESGNKNYIPRYERPRLSLLPISIVSFALSVDYFIDANNFNNDVDDIKAAADKQRRNLFDFEENAIKRLENSSTRKTIFGVTFLIAGIVNTYFALEKVEVKATPSSVGFSYLF